MSTSLADLTEYDRRIRRGVIRAAPDDYIWCRTFGHAWDAWHSSALRPQFGYYESVYCGRCSTERHFTIDSNGNVTARRYIYPPDYRFGFRLTAAEARRELRKRGWWDPKAREVAAATYSRPRTYKVRKPRHLAAVK